MLSADWLAFPQQGRRAGIAGLNPQATLYGASSAGHHDKRPVFYPQLGENTMKLSLLSMEETAAKLGVSRQMVLKYINSGRIPTIEIGGRKFVEAKHAKKPPAVAPGPKPGRKSKAGKG